ATAGAAKKDSKEAYHTAFLAAISEYNNYGAAKTSSKYQIDSGTANAMFGLKVEIVTLLGTVHEHMVKAVDASGNSLFSKEVLEDVNRRILEGDYHEEAGTHLEAICQAFKPNHMAMWADNLPSLRSDSAMGDAENALNQMSAETQRLTWEQDTLKLASDVAMIGKMYSSFQKSERTRNSLGATLVENTMDRWCKHVTGTEDLNTIATQIKNILSRRPLASMAVVMAPRIEEKLEAKDLTSEMIIVRMENPPSSKAVPMNLPGWLVYDDAGVDDNEFASCRLRMDRGTREPIPWTPQRLYVVPNERRMAAQLLAGGEFPVSVMSACLTGANQALLPAVKASRLVRVINITPYDGHFEKAMLRYHLGEDERPRISCLSVGQDPAIMQYSQSVLALSLMEDWKNDHKMLHSEPGYKKYEKNPVEPTTDFDLRDFPLKMVTCTLDNSKRSLEKLRLALPTEIRTKYAADPLRSQEWLELVAAFDSQFGTNTPAATEASAAPAAAGTSKPGWSSEPTTLDALCSTYDIEFKIASRTPGASLFIVKATDRGGNLSEVEEGQDMKMFLVATAAASPTTARPSPLPMQSEDRTDPMQREKRSELAQSLAVAMKQTKEKLKKDGGDSKAKDKLKKDSGDSKAKATGLSAAQSWAKAKNEGKNDAKKKGPKSKKAKKAKAESEEHHIEGEGEEEEDLDEVDALGEGLLDSDEDINKDEKKEAKKKAKAKETAKDEKDTEETDDKKPEPSEGDEATEPEPTGKLGANMLSEYHKAIHAATARLTAEHPDKNIKEIRKLAREEHPGDVANMLKCAWHDDSDRVVMEVNVNARASDSEPCSLRQMLLELEEAGLVDSSLNGDDRFEITPKASPLYYQYTMVARTAIGGQKYTSVASAFPSKVLLASRALHMLWRVSMAPERNDAGIEGKPLYFLDQDMELAADRACIHLVCCELTIAFPNSIAHDSGKSLTDGSADTRGTNDARALLIAADAGLEDLAVTQYPDHGYKLNAHSRRALKTWRPQHPKEFKALSQPWCAKQGLEGVALYPAISFEGRAAFVFQELCHPPPDDQKFLPWPRTHRGKFRVDCPRIGNSDVLGMYKEFQIHGEVCLKKHVQRLVATNKYREAAKYERSRNIEMTKAGAQDGTYVKAGAYNDAPLYHCPSTGWIFFDRPRNRWLIKAETGGNPKVVVGMLVTTQRTPGGTQAGVVAKIMKDDQVEITWADGNQVDQVKSTDDLYPVSQARHFNDDGTFKLQAMADPFLKDTAPPSSGWLAAPEASGYVEQEAFDLGMKNLGVEESQATALASVLRSQTLKGETVIMRRPGPDKSFDEEWAKLSRKEDASTAWKALALAAQSCFFEKRGVPKEAQIIQTEHPYPAVSHNWKKEIQMPGEKGMTVVFSQKCLTFDSCASLRVKSGGIPKSTMGPGLRVEVDGLDGTRKFGAICEAFVEERGGRMIKLDSDEEETAKQDAPPTPKDIFAFVVDEKESLRIEYDFNEFGNPGKEIKGLVLDPSRPHLPVALSGFSESGPAQAAGVKEWWRLDIVQTLLGDSQYAFEAIQGEDLGKAPQDAEDIMQNLNGCFRRLQAALTHKFDEESDYQSLTFYFVNGLEYKLVPEAHITFEGRKVSDEIKSFDDEGGTLMNPKVKEFSRQDGPLFAAGVRPGWILSLEDTFSDDNPDKKPDLSKEDVQSDPSKVLDLENVTLVFECEDAEPIERGQFYGEGSYQYQSLELEENICTVSWETDGDGGGSPERRWGILALIVPSDSEPKVEGPARWRFEQTYDSVRILSAIEPAFKYVVLWEEDYTFEQSQDEGFADFEKAKEKYDWAVSQGYSCILVEGHFKEKEQSGGHQLYWKTRWEENYQKVAGQKLDPDVEDTVNVDEEVKGEDGEVLYIKLSDGRGYVGVFDGMQERILKKCQPWDLVIAEASEALIRAEGIGDATPLASREGWDEARLRALCARHGWEFEWMSEDGERRRRGAERQSMMPLPAVTMKADTQCPDGFQPTAATQEISDKAVGTATFKWFQFTDELELIFQVFMAVEGILWALGGGI
ncbi:unnamed protein product, partial [Symbiodinium sp. CCMP2592]